MTTGSSFELECRYSSPLDQNRRNFIVRMRLASWSEEVYSHRAEYDRRVPQVC